MKCPKCGHENSDIRLFCSNCGEVLPEEADAMPQTREDDIRIYEKPVAKTASEPAAEAPSEETEPVELIDISLSPEPDEEETVRPGFIEDPWPESEVSESKNGPASLFDDVQDYVPAQSSQKSEFSRPVIDDTPRRPVLNRRAEPDVARANTYIPKRDEHLDPDDFFAVRGQVLPEYDEAEEKSARRRRKETPKYEDSAPQSFAVRHMRGIVSIALLAVTAIIVLVWANTDNAQRALAKIDVAWKPEAYVALAEEAKEAGDLSNAGYYYHCALERDTTNYNYAISAANAYLEGGYKENAAEALRKCIDLNPKDPELYIALMEVGGGYENISEDDRQLVDHGYSLTQDSRLNMK